MVTVQHVVLYVGFIDTAGCHNPQKHVTLHRACFMIWSTTISSSKPLLLTLAQYRLLSCDSSLQHVKHHFTLASLSCCTATAHEDQAWKQYPTLDWTHLERMRWYLHKITRAHQQLLPCLVLGCYKWICPESLPNSLAALLQCNVW
jgi:hypothetical protein